MAKKSKAKSAGKRNKRSLTLQSNGGRVRAVAREDEAILYARVGAKNKDFVTKTATKLKVSEAILLDFILDTLRQSGKFSCSSLAKTFKAA